MKIAIVTDSSSGITAAEAKDAGIFIVPIPFTVNGKDFVEDGSLTTAQFFKMLEQKDATASTSQPAQITLENLWRDLLTKFDHVIYLPITSGLSASCQNATEYARQFNGRVTVINNLRISAPLKISVIEAAKMAADGKSLADIVNYLNDTKHLFSIYITLSTLKFLRKGGRVTPATAMLGDMLKLKPILYTRGQNFDKYAVALTLTQAKKKMMAKIKAELQTEFAVPYAQGKMALLVAYAAINDAEIKKFHKEINAAFPGMKILYTDPLCLGIACHTGPGVLGFGTCICDYL